MTDLEFALKCAESAECKVGRRAKRLLSLYMAGRTPSCKQLKEYNVMLAVARNVRLDVDKIWSFECEAASFND